MRLSDLRDIQTRRELYQTWAMNLETLYEAGQLPIIERNQICTYIINAIQRQGATLSEMNYVTEVLPSQYKRTYELSSTNQSTPGNTPVQESSIIVENAFSIIQWLERLDPSHLTRKDHQDLYDRYNKLLHKQKEACEHRHIIVMDAFSEGWTPPKSPYDDPVHMQTPQAVHTALVDDIMALGDDIHHYGRAVKQYPPLLPGRNPQTATEDDIDVEKMQRFRRGIYAFRCLVWPSLDRKWRSSWLMWHKHINDTLDHGLHAAMSMSKIQTSVLKTFRGVTREQIDAKAAVCIKFFTDFATGMPGAIEFFEYFERYMAPFRRQLSVDLHDKLSHES